MDDSNELECRVCRCGAEEERPLYNPCLCSGSIALVHQDCLEQWLTHSNKDKCELCSTEYIFVPEYAENTPAVVPYPLVLKSALKIFLIRIIPIMVKISLAVILWLLFVPLWTSWVYRIYLREQKYRDVIVARSALPYLRGDVISGLVIIGVILLSSIILMSFADFVRLFWGGEVPVREERNPVGGHEPLIPRLNEDQNVNDNLANIVNPNVVNEQVSDERLTPIHGFPADNNHAPESVMSTGRASETESLEDDFLMVEMRRSYRQSFSGDALTGKFVDWSSQRPPELASETNNNGKSFEFDAYKSEEDFSYYSEDLRESSGLIHRRNTPAAASRTATNTSSYEPSERNDRFPFDSPILPASNEKETEEKRVPQLISPVDDSVDMMSEENVDDVDDNADEWENDIDDAAPPDPVGADVEVRFALDELLGLRGPYFNMVKHVIWFLTFIGVYLFLFVFLPVSVGSIIVEVIYKHCPWMNSVLKKVFPEAVYDIVSRAQLTAQEKKSALYISDLILNIIGYFTIYGITAIWNIIMSFIRSTMIQSLDRYVKFLDNLVIAGKIGALLSIRIFLLPLTLGLIILSCCNTIFQYSNDAIVLYLAENLVGCLTFAWTIGISYMLVITLSVLQLREILHPDILAKNIRPQETHSELLHSLISESGFTHFRRLAVSMIVYIVLSIFLLYLPFTIAKFVLVHGLGITSHEIRVWYFVPELQLPLEVGVGHFSMLTLLEGKKNYIGRFIFKWMSFICRKLKATRFVLPCPMKRTYIPGQLAIRAGEINQRDASGSSKRCNRGINATILRDSRGNPLVGKPLRRPPPGWDARNHDHQPYDNKMTSRWAWGTEEPSDVEANVAPRLIPSDWPTKTFLLLASSWALITTVIVFLIIVPTAVGREVLYKVCLPTNLHHDPVAFALGLFVCYLCFKMTKSLFSFGGSRIISAFKRVPFQSIKSVLELTLLWNTTHIVFKIIMELAHNPSTTIREIAQLSFLFKMWSSYHVPIDTLVVIFIDGGADFVLSKIGQPDLFGISRWCQSIRTSVNSLIKAWVTLNFENDTVHLDDLKKSFIRPLFDTIVIHAGLTIAAGWVLAFLTYGFILCFNFLFPSLHTTSVPSFDATVTRANSHTTLFIFGYYLKVLLSQPLVNLQQRFYQAIKDENYLTGRKLQNVAIGRTSSSYRDFVPQS